MKYLSSCLNLPMTVQEMGGFTSLGVWGPCPKDSSFLDVYVGVGPLIMETSR